MAEGRKEEMLKIVSACGCNTGCVRSSNEDNLYFNGEILPRDNCGMEGVLTASETLVAPVFFGVFDGMGGEAYGEVASYIAAEELRLLPTTASCAELQDVLKRANDKICSAAQERLCSVIGTTAAVLRLESHLACVINVGDSRVYRLRNGELRQLSTDHTDKEMLLRYGIEGRKPRLTQHLGIDPTEMLIEPSAWQGDLVAEDVFLLCSDGLSDMLSAEEIAEGLSLVHPADCVKTLVGTALSNGGRDNVTVIVARVERE